MPFISSDVGQTVSNDGLPAPGVTPTGLTICHLILLEINVLRLHTFGILRRHDVCPETEIAFVFISFQYKKGIHVRNSLDI